MAESVFEHASNYTNRELSWLQFDRRILEEARDRNNPILDRLKFASITSSNLDEFFMVRVASLKDMVHAGYKKRDIAGLTAQEQLAAINRETRELMDAQYVNYRRSMMPALKKEGIHIIDAWEDLTPEQAAYADTYFEERIYPVLTPMAVDASRPFPLIQNKSLNIAALIRSKQETSGLQERVKEAAELRDEEAAPEKKKTKKNKKKKEAAVDFATVQVPSGLPRLIELPREDGVTFVLLEQVIEKNLSRLFLQYDVICAYPYRIMRNADLSFDEDEASDLLEEIQRQLKNRQWGEVIRLEIEAGADPKLLSVLAGYLDVKNTDIFPIAGPVDLTFLMKLYGLEGCDHLREVPYTPQPNPAIAQDADLFEVIRKGDVFLHHPYQTFSPVVNLIRQAATDDSVLAIKMTLYRVSSNSPIIAALERAAEAGKQVTVLVELKARFDEEHNIVWAKELERAGCHVIYGLVGLKTHSKIALVVRREEDGIRRYVHLGTGNYNDSTAKLYTDCGILTCSEPIGEDATAVFNMLSGYSEPAKWNRLIVAPLWMRTRFLELIRRETAHAKAGRPAAIIAKMNSLCDKELIAALYEASAAGVEIDLVIRGICCLKTGIPGISEHIRVRSIVGTFLEHARIFWFFNDGDEQIFMGSADWMPRNMDRRVEIVFPVEQADCKAAAKHILDVQLADNLKAYELLPSGEYVHPDRRGKQTVGAQDTFMKEAVASRKETEAAKKTRTFEPRMAPEAE